MKITNKVLVLMFFIREMQSAKSAICSLHAQHCMGEFAHDAQGLLPIGGLWRLVASAQWHLWVGCGQWCRVQATAYSRTKTSHESRITRNHESRNKMFMTFGLCCHKPRHFLPMDLPVTTPVLDVFVQSLSSGTNRPNLDRPNLAQ